VRIGFNNEIIARGADRLKVVRFSDWCLRWPPIRTTRRALRYRGQ
jgi:hypothetical protein